MAQTPTVQYCDKHGPYTAAFYECLSGAEPCKRCIGEEEYQTLQQRERLFRLSRVAGIPPRFANKTLDTYQAESKEQQQGLSFARDYVTNFQQYFEAGRCIALCGNPGTGKTHLACGIAHALLSQERPVRYATVLDVIRTIRETWRHDSQEAESAVLRRLISVDLLILDEVGVQFGTEAEKIQLFQVIDGRYQAVRPTILISNLDVKGLTNYLGERTIDRLRENNGRMLIFTGESWRARVAQGFSERKAEGVVQ